MDKDKDKGKDNKTGDGWNLDGIETIFVLIVVLSIVSTIVPLLISYFNSGNLSFFGFNIGGFFKSIFDFIKNHLLLLKVLGVGLAGAGAIGTFVFNKMADSIVSSTLSSLYPPFFQTGSSLSGFSGAGNGLSVPSGVGGAGSSGSRDLISGTRSENLNGNGEYANNNGQNKTKNKWQKIVELVESNEESNWRLAIIEADIILDSLLEKLRLPGQTIGDKLKAVERSDFLTIDLAWEAHKARNNIAHEGGDFMLNQREGRRIISLYETVFKEFEII